jgi:hypothetical protein
MADKVERDYLADAIARVQRMKDLGMQPWLDPEDWSEESKIWMAAVEEYQQMQETRILQSVREILVPRRVSWTS